jgi:hypothetical protein
MMSASRGSITPASHPCGGEGPNPIPTLLEVGQQKEPTQGAGSFRGNVRRCPTLPRGLPRSTIGAEGLNFRVRDGTGCFPLAMAAATLWKYQP